MAPFPEAEDMTVKRLYVALKRSDMQLLQMGAHKLHEKYHTGYKFELLDDLRQILSYVEEQTIPNDIKDLLTKTINDILTGETPDIKPIEENPPVHIEEIKKYNETGEENFVQDETTSNIEQKEEPPVIFTPKEPESAVQSAMPLFNQTTEQKPEIKPVQIQPEIQPDTIEEEKPTVENVVNLIQEAPKEERFEPSQNEYPAKILEEKESTLNDVMVFYDDKAPFIDFAKNKMYRNGLDLISLNNEAHPIEDASIVKNIVDVQTDEIGEILKMLNTIKGNVYFVTTSKSENILKTFVEYDVNFEIPHISNQGAKTKIIPLFGLSNIFKCPKCGKKEYFAGLHNKVLSLQCNNCSGVMYPDIYEAENLETNSNPYFWLSAVKSMAKADTWILINPPLETNKALISELIKTAYEVSKPKRVYILSKETTKKEYYKQAFKEISPECIVKSDFIVQDALCEEFINSEMSTIKVNI